MRLRVIAVIAVLALVTSLAAVEPTLVAQAGAPGEHWVGTWATAPVSAPSQPPAQPQPGLGAAALRINNQTLRQFVHASVGGTRVRIVLTNAFGTRPLVIGGAHLALRDKGAAIAAGSGRALTFGESQTAVIPPGAVLMSDAVTLTVLAFADIAIDLYVPGDTAASPSPLTIHGGARQTNYVSAAGNHLGASELPGATAMTSWYFLSRLEVAAPDRVGAVVALGDSITDGFNSTNDTNNRWPDHLARRLISAAATPGTSSNSSAAGASSAMGVLNLGIDGNRVLADGAGVSALARFDRDVLAQSGVTHVFVLEGINDLGIPGLFMDGPRPTVQELIAGHRQLIARARAKGLKIFASTLLPYEGTTIPGYYTEDGNTIRQAFNQWMRTSKEYDGIVDLDATIRDPEHPNRMLPKYDSGDHLHPSDAGYKAMADAVDLAWLKEGLREAAAAR